MKRKACGIVLVALGLLVGACDDGNSFKIKTMMPANGMFVAAPNVFFNAAWQTDFPGVVGGNTFVAGTTDAGGNATLHNVRIPAQWAVAPNCAHSLPTIAPVSNGITLIVRCFTGSVFPFHVTPGTIAASDAPDSLLLSSTEAGVEVTQGTSQVLFYDAYGTLIAQSAVSSVSGDGTQFEVDTPASLRSQPSGTYVLVVQGADSQSVGAGTLDLIGGASWPPPDPEPDPCGGGLSSFSACPLD